MIARAGRSQMEAETCASLGLRKTKKKKKNSADRILSRINSRLRRLLLSPPSGAPAPFDWNLQIRQRGTSGRQVAVAWSARNRSEVATRNGGAETAATTLAPDGAEEPSPRPETRTKRGHSGGRSSSPTSGLIEPAHGAVIAHLAAGCTVAARCHCRQLRSGDIPAGCPEQWPEPRRNKWLFGAIRAERVEIMSAAGRIRQGQTKYAAPESCAKRK